jgi:hypothetical protein
MRKSKLLVIAVYFFSAMSANAFDNNPNKVDPNNIADKRLRSYVSQDAVKPTSQGGYYGGHNGRGNDSKTESSYSGR